MNGKLCVSTRTQTNNYVWTMYRTLCCHTMAKDLHVNFRFTLRGHFPLLFTTWIPNFNCRGCKMLTNKQIYYDYTFIQLHEKTNRTIG